MHRRFIFVVTAIALTLASCGGGSEATPARPTATATATATATTPPSTPESTPTATATVAAATATPSPVIEATTPITAHTAPTATATAQPATPTTAPATSAPPPPPPPTATPTTAPPPAASNPLSANVGVTGSARYFWSPAKPVIAPGGAVTWTWSGEVPHDLKVLALGFSSEVSAVGTHTLIFPAAGTYAFSCSVHNTMTGTVTVE